MLVHGGRNQVTAAVANSFRHCGSGVTDEDSGTKAAFEPSQHDVIPTKLCDALELVSFDMDSNAVVCSAANDRYHCASN